MCGSYENRFCVYPPLLILLSVVIASFVIAQTNEIVIENARISAKLSTGFAESSSYSYSTGYELWMGTGHDIAVRYGVGYYLEIYRNVSGSLESIYSQSCTGYGYATEPIVSAPRVPIHEPSLVASPSSVPIPIPGVGTASRASAVYGIGYGLEIVDNASGSMLYGSTPTGSGLARSVSVVLGAVGKGSNTTLGYGAWLSTSYVATVQSVAYYALSIEKNGVVVHSLSYSPSYGYGLGLDLDVEKVVVRSYEPRPPPQLRDGGSGGDSGNGGGSTTCSGVTHAEFALLQPAEIYLDYATCSVVHRYVNASNTSFTLFLKDMAGWILYLYRNGYYMGSSYVNSSYGIDVPIPSYVQVYANFDSKYLTIDFYPGTGGGVYSFEIWMDQAVRIELVDGNVSVSKVGNLSTDFIFVNFTNFNYVVYQDGYIEIASGTVTSDSYPIDIPYSRPFRAYVTISLSGGTIRIIYYTRSYGYTPYINTVIRSRGLLIWHYLLTVNGYEIELLNETAMKVRYIENASHTLILVNMSGYRFTMFREGIKILETVINASEYPIDLKLPCYVELYVAPGVNGSGSVVLYYREMSIPEMYGEEPRPPPAAFIPRPPIPVGEPIPLPDWLKPYVPYIALAIIVLLATIATETTAPFFVIAVVGVAIAFRAVGWLRLDAVSISIFVFASVLVWVLARKTS